MTISWCGKVEKISRERLPNRMEEGSEEGTTSRGQPRTR